MSSTVQAGDTVACIKTWRSSQDAATTLDYGTKGKRYEVLKTVAEGRYLVLKGLGAPGEPNHLVNVERFQKVEM